MVKNTHKLKRDPTIALDLFESISQSPLYSILIKHYPIETQHLLLRLKALDTTKEANQIPTLLSMIDDYGNACQQYMKLSTLEKDEVEQFFSALSSHLQHLSDNILEQRIEVTCALDGHTLNRTTDLIRFLQDFIHEQDIRNNIKQSFLSHTKEPENSKKVASFYDANKAQYKTVEKELDIAKQLKDICVKIRSQIGSPETKPKGLVIQFVVYLLEGIRSCKELYNQDQGAKSKLYDLIKLELAEIENLYPDLVHAGEDLQKSYCKSSASKIIINQ